MKKITIVLLIVVIALSICACGRSDRDETSIPTQPSNPINIMPSMDPTIDTNIPDPDVNSTMPMYTDGTDATNSTGNVGGTGSNGNEKTMN